MPLQSIRSTGPAAAATAALLCVLAVLAGCGGQPQPSPSSAPPSTSAPSPTPTALTTACADIENLKASVETLRKVNPATDGAAALTAAIADVQAKLATAEKSATASPTLQPSLTQVRQAVNELQDSASGVTAGNVAQKAPAIVAATRKVTTAMSELSAVVDQVCS